MPLDGYSPFIRFAFARYQPNSIRGAHLSKVVVVDFAQLAPNRSVTVAGHPSDRNREVTVAGRAATATHHSGKASQMLAIVEHRDPRIADEALAWSRAKGIPNEPYSAVFELTASTTDTDHVTWTGQVSLPTGPADTVSTRVTFEEHERIAGGAGNGRLVWTDSLPLFTLPE